MAKKGGIKTGGRQKGTPNKRTVQAQEIADRIGVDPLEVLMRYAAGDWEGLGYHQPHYVKVTSDGREIFEDVIQPDQRIAAAKEAAKYLYPQRKAVEFKSEDDTGIAIVVKDYTSKE